MEQLALPVAVLGVEVGFVEVFFLLVPVGDILLGVEHVDVLAGTVERDTGGEVDLGLAALTLLGGDEHDTVGGAATVDGCGRGVFQHLDALDVLGVDTCQTALGGLHGVATCATTAVGVADVLGSVVHDNTIDHIQRFLVTVEGRGTADAHVDESTQLRVAAVDIHTGGVTLQQVVDT